MKYSLALFLPLLVISCHAGKSESAQPANLQQADKNMEQSMETATFAGGCFWCTEAVFLEIEGVKSINPGYIGGKMPNPSYDEVCSGTTGHAEAVQIMFDPKQVSYGDLLEIFFATHDPTTLNRQGNDVGTQYRSEIFYHSEEQKKQAEDYITLLDSESVFGKKIVTRVSPESTFYVAEDYHKNYYARNKNQSYCHFVITPKIDKVREKFQEKLKK